MDLAELCALLGWQGGTIHQVEAEITRLRKLECLMPPPTLDALTAAMWTRVKDARLASSAPPQAPTDPAKGVDHA